MSLVFVLCFTVYTVLVTPGTSLSNDEPVNVRWRFKKLDTCICSVMIIRELGIERVQSTH